MFESGVSIRCEGRDRMKDRAKRAVDMADMGLVENGAVRGVFQIDMQRHGSSLSLQGEEP